MGRSVSWASPVRAILVVLLGLVLSAPQLANAGPRAPQGGGRGRPPVMPRLAPPRPAGFMRRPPVVARAIRERPAPQAQMGPNGPYQAAPPPTRHLYRGEYLPDGGFGAPIQNPDRFHLRRAPPGYFWVRRGGDMLLIQGSTGLVAETIPEGY